MEKGQAPSTGSEPEVIEVTGHERGEQETVGRVTIKGAKGANPAVEEEAEAEVPLVQKRRRLMKVGDMVSTREGASSGEVVPATDGSDHREKSREVGEDASAPEGSRADDGAEETRAELPLV